MVALTLKKVFSLPRGNEGGMQIGREKLLPNSSSKFNPWVEKLSSHP